MARSGHEPVTVAEVTELLAERGTVVDMTLGAGGHAEALLEAGVERVVGVDRDPEAIREATERLARFGNRFSAVSARFSTLPVGNRVDGVLYDLGVSSMQLDRPERGFSYRHPGPLDMRMGPEGDSAMDLVNSLSETELADLIYRYGEERRSRRAAAAIVRARFPCADPDDRRARPRGRRCAGSAAGRGPHPARRTFQALRIAVNRELEELAASLPRAVGLLGPGGRVAVISYRSLEDGLVKRGFRDDERVRVLTKKPHACAGRRAQLLSPAHSSTRLKQ